MPALPDTCYLSLPCWATQFIKFFVTNGKIQQLQKLLKMKENKTFNYISLNITWKNFYSLGIDIQLVSNHSILTLEIKREKWPNLTSELD